MEPDTPVDGPADTPAGASDLQTGRIDVHAHLLPAVDDGCRSLEESMDCARELVLAGYTHCFCTPHVWPNLPQNNVRNITQRVERLQDVFDDAGIPLTLFPGGEINLRPDTPQTPPEELVTFGMAGQFVLIDLWADRVPPFFVPAVTWLQSQGVQVILAHPERMKAVQDQPGLLDRFGAIGILLQGNLQCLADPPGSPTREVAEEALLGGKYFLLGSDLHNRNGLEIRMEGLQRAIELVGEEAVAELTINNPRQLLP